MNFSRLFDIIDFQLRQYPQDKALSYYVEDAWRSFSLADCITHINSVSLMAMRSHWKKGDRVAFIFEKNTPYWNFIDFGLLQAGIVTVPIHATSSAEEIIYICRETEAVCLLVSGSGLRSKISRVVQECPDLKEIGAIDNVPGLETWDGFHLRPDETESRLLQQVKDNISEQDLATIIYTSGTTGLPKGVMLSHLNIVSNIKASMTLIPVTPVHRVISFLPISHAFERMVIYSYIAVGAAVYYAEQSELLDRIKSVQPHYLSAVPRFPERVYDIIIARARHQPRWVRWLVQWAIRLGERYSPNRQLDPWYRTQLLFADLLIFRWWRKALGGYLKGVFVGAAALNPKLGRLFTAAGIRIVEGYGLTETSPVVAFNRFEPGGTQFGTVGIVIPGLDVKIDAPNEAGEGEILVKGPNVMQGYYKHPEWTAEVMTDDGWLRTGDVGKFVKKRFLQITDRRKDIFKTTHGKYIAPQSVENHLKTSPYINQCMIIGANKPTIAALIVPDFNYLEQWCKEHGVHWTAPLYMVHNPMVVKKMNEVVAHLNESLSNLEKVKKIHLLPEEWSPESGELTPTLKNKRAVIEKKFAREVGDMFG